MHELVMPSQGGGVTGENGIYSKGTGEQRPNLRTGNIRKQIFDFLGNMGTSQFISEDQGNMYPPWEGIGRLTFGRIRITKELIYFHERAENRKAK